MKPASVLIAGTAFTALAALTWAGISQWPALSPAGSGDRPAKTATVRETRTAPAPVRVATTAATVHRPGLSVEQEAVLANWERLAEQENGTADAALEPFRAWAANDPAAAASRAMNLPDGPARRRLLTEAIALWASRSPQQALEWLDAQPQQEGTEEAFTAAFASLAAGDAPAAAAWLQRHPDLASRENHEILLSHWTASDAPAASAWLHANLSSEMQEALLPSVIAGIRSAESAAGLVQSLPPAHADAVLATAIGGVNHADPQYALDLAARLSDPSAGAALVESIRRDFEPPASASVAAPVPATGDFETPVAVE